MEQVCYMYHYICYLRCGTYKYIIIFFSAIDLPATNRKVESSNRVVAQRAIFEHGHTQELENNILRSAQIERQRELDMLRSRFNTNKEIAQVAAGSCIRTSESSEGKSNSPKNSPICPVKPTPALVIHLNLVIILRLI